MKRKVILPLEMCCTIEKLCDEYEELYGTAVPDFVFFEMILSLGLDYMSSILTKKTDSMKVEVNEK